MIRSCRLDMYLSSVAQYKYSPSPIASSDRMLYVNRRNLLPAADSSSSSSSSSSWWVLTSHQRLLLMILCLWILPVSHDDVIAIYITRTCLGLTCPAASSAEYLTWTSWQWHVQAFNTCTSCTCSLLSPSSDVLFCCRRFFSFFAASSIATKLLILPQCDVR